MNLIKLKDAGHREKLFVKSKLAQEGKIDFYDFALNTWYFDVSKDIVITNKFKKYKVTREGSKSTEILEMGGHDVTV